MGAKSLCVHSIKSLQITVIPAVACIMSRPPGISSGFRLWSGIKRSLENIEGCLRETGGVCGFKVQSYKIFLRKEDF